jgi:hypothetical protein
MAERPTGTIEVIGLDRTETRTESDDPHRITLLENPCKHGKGGKLGKS